VPRGVEDEVLEDVLAGRIVGIGGEPGVRREGWVVGVGDSLDVHLVPAAEAVLELLLGYDRADVIADDHRHALGKGRAIEEVERAGV